MAIYVSGLGVQHWQASVAQRPLRDHLSTPTFQLLTWISLTLIGLGFSGTSQTWWERAGWLILTGLALINLVLKWRSWHQSHTKPSSRI